MKFRSVGLLLIGILLIVAGSTIWQSRFTYAPENVLQSQMNDRLMEISASETLDLSEACQVAAEEGGWVLFVLNASIVNDVQIRTFFETAPEPLGLFVEYEPGLLRLGLGMGPGNLNEAGELVSNIETPIRRVHRAEDVQVFIGITKDETRVVTNTRDTKIAWPGYLADEWRCNAVQVATDTRKSSHGYMCSGCHVQLRYATGGEAAEIKELLDSFSNVPEFNLRRGLGSGLIFLGLIFVAIVAQGSRMRLNIARRI